LRPRPDRYPPFAAATPLIPLRIFQLRNLSGANVIQALFVAGMFGVFFLGALYLQRVLGFSALEVLDLAGWSSCATRCAGSGGP
jgi:hypothetical protein